MLKPTFVNYVTPIEADWLNTISDTVFDALDQATTPGDALTAIGAQPEAPAGGPYVGSNGNWSEAFLTGVTDSSTVDLTVASANLSAAVITQKSLEGVIGGVQLVGDAASPGNSKYYGTNSSGVKSFYDLPSGGGTVQYIQDSEPFGGVEKETWWNPLTLQLKVFHLSVWESVSPDGGYF